MFHLQSPFSLVNPLLAATVSSIPLEHNFSLRDCRLCGHKVNNAIIFVNMYSSPESQADNTVRGREGERVCTGWKHHHNILTRLCYSLPPISVLACLSPLAEMRLRLAAGNGA